MRRVNVEFECEIPGDIDVADWEIEAWVRFNLRESCQLSGDNPLIDHEMDAVFRTVMVTT